MRAGTSPFLCAPSDPIVEDISEVILIDGVGVGEIISCKEFGVN